MTQLLARLGRIDIYWFDQILRGRITPGMRILDAGCGAGRNLAFLMRQGYELFGADKKAEAIESVRRLAAQLAPRLPAENFRLEPLEAMSFEAESVDAVICSAVLHFAADEDHFWRMVEGIWRVLKPGGLFFCRLASSIGMEEQVHRIEGRRYALPDGSERFLVDQAMLLDLTRRLGGELADPIKTTVVQNLRCMTTWVVRKGS